MVEVNYSKPAIKIADQIAQLRRRGMIILPEDRAEHYLAQISYYRLAGYWWTMQSSTTAHTFRPGSRFATVIQRYDFDRELRLIVLDMVERIEVAIRTHLIYYMSLAYGSHWFEERRYARNKRHFTNNLKQIEEEVRRSREPFISVHRKKYANDPRNPPVWKSFEVISLGLLSKMYSNIKPRLPEKDTIAQQLGLPNHTFLLSWLRNISVIRNTAAHHSRLFRKGFSQQPTLPTKLHNPWIDEASLPSANTVYATLCCMKYLLWTISPHNRFPQRLGELFVKYPDVLPGDIGMKVDWRKQPLWR
jgi:abortive infection bacteriophage resistance protein